jgi:hypothetical protein
MYTLGIERCYTQAKDEAKQMVDEGLILYSVGLFNERDDMVRMNYITNYAYTGFDNAYRQFDGPEQISSYYYHYADDTSAINDVFADIIEDISKSFAYKNVEISDTMSSSTKTSLSIAGHADDFVYYKNDKNGQLVEWAPEVVPGDGGAPHAVFDEATGSVSWDLSGIGRLENDMKYTVSFTVWPNQDAYDCVL